VSAGVDLPAGALVARAVFTLAGAFTGDLQLFYDDVPVGRGRIARMQPITYGMHGFAVGYQPGGPITPACPGRSEITVDVLRRVVVEVVGTRPRDAEAQARAGLAMQ
jgi:hypothetical protein